MRKIIGAPMVSLDGIMQAPGGPTEDPTGGFELGGWVWPYFDEESGKFIDSLFNQPFDLLLGRRTYEIFAAYWPYKNDEIGAAFNKCTKYVLTHGAVDTDWKGSLKVSIEELRKLKGESGPDLIIQGSCSIYPQLLQAGLIDELRLLTFPVILGNGKRLFGDGTPPGALKLVQYQTSPNGVTLSVYKPDGEVKTGASPGLDDPSQKELVRRKKMDEGIW